MFRCRSPQITYIYLLKEWVILLFEFFQIICDALLYFLCFLRKCIKIVFISYKYCRSMHIWCIIICRRCVYTHIHCNTIFIQCNSSSPSTSCFSFFSLDQFKIFLSSYFIYGWVALFWIYHIFWIHHIILHLYIIFFRASLNFTWIHHILLWCTRAFR